MNSLLIDLQYFPGVEYYLTLYKFSNVEFDQYDPHKKMSFRNRSIIAGANGVINLSIPLVGGRDQRTVSKDVKIDYTFDWQLRHKRAIISSYNRSPFFEFYSDNLESLFYKKPVFLFDWNLECITWIRQQTGLPARFSRSGELKTAAEFHGYTDLRNYFNPKSQAGDGTKNLTYRQVFEDRFGFQGGLSILDFLFCAGGAAVDRTGRFQQGVDLNQ